MDNTKWNVVECSNFNKDLAAYEEVRIMDSIPFNEASDFINENMDSERILYAYSSHTFGGMAGCIWNNAYTEAQKKIKKYAKLID